MESLEKSIKAIQKDIKKHISYVNSGGCVHFAYYSSKRLTELKIKHSITFLDRDNISLSYSKFDSVAHIMVYVPGIGFVDGIRTQRKPSRRYYRRKTAKVSLKKLDSFRSEADNWNPTYNTCQNDLLESIINDHLK